MAWQTELTQQRLLDAAVEEFAAFGFSGARVDRIASRAGISKERIYSYFGDKQALFTEVLSRELTRLATAVPLDDESAADLGTYAGQVLDHHRSHPALLRLLCWEGLERSDAAVVEELERTRYYQDKIAAVGRAQRAGHLTTAATAAELLYAVIALAAWWAATPQMTRMLAGQRPAEGDPPGSAFPGREAVVTLARRMTSDRR